MRIKKYTESQLREAIAQSFSLRETLKRLGISPAGGNYQSLHKAIAYFSIDSSHFTGQGHLKGKINKHAIRPLESILIYGKYENTYRLKLRLIRAGLKAKVCEECLLSEWRGQEIPLELHHEDGDKKNNQLFNLKLLCPNCHALTDNYRGKNKKA